jgi:hypothetical protein
MDIPTTAPSLFAYLTRVPNSYKTLYASSYSAFPVELPEPLTPRAKEKMSNLHVCVCVWLGWQPQFHPKYATVTS